MRRAGLLALLVLAGGWDALRAPDPDVDKGNQAFQKGRYDEALGHYRSAETRGVEPRLHFDMGAALYKLSEKATDQEEKAKLLLQAEEQFRRAADTDDARLKSSAYYNLGNAMYQRQQWEDSISAYKRALRANPNNESARHNLEMALRQRQKQDKQQQHGQQGQQGQPDKQQGQQDQQERQQGQQQGQQGQQQGQKDPQGQQGQEQKEQDQAQQGGQGQQPDQPDPQQGQQQRPDDQREAERQRQEEREGRQRQQQGQEPDEAEQPSEGDSSDSDRPTDQERKLDELERRSRDLRKRLLRQGGKSRDPLRLPSRKDW